MIFCSGFLGARDETLKLLKEFRTHDLPDFLKEFRVYDSIPKLKWSGGRVVPNMNSDFNLDFIKMYNDEGIGIYPTLTNLIYDDLEDPYLIATLEELNKEQINGVILTSDKLYQFVRDNFKNIKISCSITKIKPFSKLQDKDIKELEAKYDYMCPRQNLYFKEDFYTRINKDQYEILLNNGCPHNCPFYTMHYKKVSKAYIDVIDKNIDYKKYKFLNKICFWHKIDSEPDVAKILSLGFRTLKFSERDEERGALHGKNQRSLKLIEEGFNKFLAMS